MPNEQIEVAVVPLPDASTQPNAMVIELQHTVVAYIAVRRPWRSEDEASLAEFELEQHGRIWVQNLGVRNLGFFVNIFVLFGQDAIHVAFPAAAWYDSRISRRCQKTQVDRCNHKVEIKENGELPPIAQVPIKLHFISNPKLTFAVKIRKKIDGIKIARAVKNGARMSFLKPELGLMKQYPNTNRDLLKTLFSPTKYIFN